MYVNFKKYSRNRFAWSTFIFTRARELYFPTKKNMSTSVNRNALSFHQYGTGGCNYARLGAYSAGFRGIRPPVPMTTVSGYYVVPDYAAPGYETLTHGRDGDCGCSSCSYPYFQIGRAYGYGAECCSTRYMGSLCGDCSTPRYVGTALGCGRERACGRDLDLDLAIEMERGRECGMDAARRVERRIDRELDMDRCERGRMIV